MNWTETTVDSQTLPMDGRFVEYELDSGTLHRGHYNSQIKQFWSNPSQWAEAFEVVKWRYL